MNGLARTFGAAVLLALLASQASAQGVMPTSHSHQRRAPIIIQECPTPVHPLPPDVKPPDVKPPVEPLPPTTDAFAQAPPAGGAESVGFNPAMFGDIVGGPTIRTVVRTPSGATTEIQIPAVSRGAFKIADNESPRPTDRIFFTYNFYDNVQTFGGTINPTFDLHRELVGFEKTLFDGNTSIGMRIPFMQLTNTSGEVDDSQFGDLSIIFKWAFINNRENGNVVSTGLVLTVPTGDDFISVTGDTIHPVLFQPYVGYIFNMDRLYIHGFSSIVVPTDDRDATLWLNDVGVGFWLARNRDGFINAIVPTIEAHVLTPLSHRGSTNSPVGIPDWLVLTGGVNFVFGGNSSLGIALGTPVTGPRPFDLEFITSLNIRF